MCDVTTPYTDDLVGVSQRVLVFVLISMWACIQRASFNVLMDMWTCNQRVSG
jgi:hypothetical protein